MENGDGASLKAPASLDAPASLTAAAIKAAAVKTAADAASGVSGSGEHEQDHRQGETGA
jgi:hypothetical protein